MNVRSEPINIAMGWRPVAVFLLATLFNTLLAPGAAWVIFTWLFPL
jgi:hypothetical protein